jgi:hypothetical protein
MIHKKISQYIEYFDGKTWTENTGHPNPSLLIVCPNEVSKIFLNKHISQALEEADEEIDFYLTTREIIEYDQLNSNIWDKVEVIK